MGNGMTASALNVWGRAALVLIGAFLLSQTFRFGYDQIWFFLCSGLMGLVWLIGWKFRVIRREVRRTSPVRSLGVGAACGLGLAVFCAIGVWLFRDLPFFTRAVEGLLSPVAPGLLWPVAITAAAVGISEELMFRGAVFSWFFRRPVLWSTFLYTIVTLVTGSAALIMAAALLGLVTGVLRLRTKGVLAPIACHLCWTLALLLALPPLMDDF